MKTKILLALMMISVAYTAESQIAINVDAHQKKPDRDITFKYISKSPQLGLVLRAIEKSTGETIEFSPRDLKNIEFTPKDLSQVWQSELLKAGTYEKLLSGYQYNIRRAMEEEMGDYLSRLEQGGRFYIDNYLETRLYGILRRIYAVRPDDGRPGVMSLRIITDLTPDAWVGPDGTMIITTGMITAVNSEDELMALMAQEVAHFALDHYMNNYDSLAAMYAETNLSLVIKYNPFQEKQADGCAVSVLKILGKNPAALGSVLRKVRRYGEITGNYYMTTANGEFPVAAGRSAAFSDTDNFFSADFERMISPIISYNAFDAYNQSQYPLCKWLLNRNMESGEATAEDYILMSKALLLLSDTEEKDREALNMVRRVIVPGNAVPSEAYKQEALVLMRMNRNDEATASLDHYAISLEDNYKKYSSMSGDWSQMLSYITAEKNWVERIRRR
ncbi:MAG: M48 family metalloprotease [Bacteroidales bacterium]